MISWQLPTPNKTSKYPDKKFYFLKQSTEHILVQIWVIIRVHVHITVTFFLMYLSMYVVADCEECVRERERLFVTFFLYKQ